MSIHKNSLTAKVLEVVSQGPITASTLADVLADDLEGIQLKHRRAAIWAALTVLERNNLVERDPLKKLEILRLLKNGKEQTAQVNQRMWRRKGARMV